MLIKILIILSLVSCSLMEDTDVRTAIHNKKWSNSFCVRTCVAEEFNNFHGGKQYSNTSMQGLSQDEIYKAVYDQCEEFVFGKTCYNKANCGTSPDCFTIE